eukprot:gene6002-gene6891
MSHSHETVIAQVYWYREGDLPPKLRYLIIYIMCSIVVLCICSIVYLERMHR